jgi:beta propeller repeat protein
VKGLLVAALVSTVFMVSASPAAVIHVPADHVSIQSAIDAAADGDTVLVGPGLYFEHISFLGKNITVTSTDPNDSGIVGYTVINAEGEGSVVTFTGQETSAVLAGFTITGGGGTLVESNSYYKYYYGGGILCQGGRATITHNVIANNILPYEPGTETVINGVTTYTYVWSDGGGIYAGGSPNITYNTIFRNQAESGGGIYGGGSGDISDNLIYDNSAAYGGGVVYYGYGRLTNNTIVGNDVSLDLDYGYGGNLVVSLGSYGIGTTIANNIVCGAKSGSGLCWYGYLMGQIRYNDVWGNTPHNYLTEDLRTYDITSGPEADLTSRYGNISADPVFQTGWTRRYRLESGSPCISAGDPNFVPSAGETDIDGDPRVYALRVDIGADEHVGYVKPIAFAGPDQHILTPDLVTLDGTGSYISDPSAGVSYNWRQTQGAEVQLDDPNAARPTFTPPEVGWYKFELIVADSQYSSGPDEVLVVVGNEPPVANAGADTLAQVPGYAILDGSGSHDPDPPDNLTYSWTQLEDPDVNLLDPNAAMTAFITTQPGIYVFSLVVSDGFVSSEPDTVKIEAAPFTLGAQTEVVTTRTPNSYSYYFNCDLSGTSVVYTGAQNTSSPSSWSIFVSDTKTGQVLKYDAGNIDVEPKADGDVIVWAGGPGSYYSPTCTSLYAANVITNATPVRLQSATSTVSYGYPAIAGNKIVYLRHTGVDTSNVDRYDQSVYDICGADISDFAHPVYFTIASQAGHGMPYDYYNYYYSNDDYVDISGNFVVWESDGDIWGADISDLNHIKTFPICTAPERQYDPAISGHTVVWTDQRKDIGDIYGADISDPNNVREFAIDVDLGEQLRADVDGPLIVYVDGDEYSGTIRICCVTHDYGVTNVTFPDQYWYGSSPHVHGSTLAWRDESYQIMHAEFDIAYALTNGPVQNVTTGAHYDYIQHAITAASDGDVILIPPGTHNERIRFGGKNVTVTSADPRDPAVRAATIIRGDGQLISFTDNETADSVLTGLTLTGGSIGVYCQKSSPTISLCDVTGNRDAGLKLWGGSKPTVSQCDIAANGTGIEMVMNVVVRSAGYSTPAVNNCLIVGNRKQGIYGSDPIVTNCTIADNGAEGVFGAHPKITNSIVYFNNAGGENVKAMNSLVVSYSDVQGDSSGQGNVDLDPLFAARGFWADREDPTIMLNPGDLKAAWFAGDYHLLSEGWRWDPLQQSWVSDEQTSPCIDAGDPTSPLGDEMPCAAGDPLSDRATPNTRVNMGAYGGTAEASLAPKAGMAGM